MNKVKKILNDPKNVVTELHEGVLEAYHGTVKPLSKVQALVKSHIPEG